MLAATSRRVFLGLFVAVLCLGFAGQSQAIDLIIGGPDGIKIDIGGGKKKYKPKPKLYSVTLYRPYELGGGVVYRKNGLTYSQAKDKEAQYKRYQWVIWKYAGVGKPWHSRMFSSYYRAQLFLKNKGPAKAANKLGIAIIAKQQIKTGRTYIKRQQ
ncbi:MAG: hypothetical protein MI757_07150 [Pirellulales bacterium]|nr:hypothetical protein [Pirellulales bacterium]